MEISTISNSNNSTNSVEKKTLGREEFLNLLLKQLSYQDPLNPMDSTQFTTQLSQFSSLEELTNINSTLSDVLAFQESMQNATLTNLIGKTVKVSGNSTYLQDTADIYYELPGDASSVKISIINAAGKLIRSEDIGPMKAGNNNYLWDGKDDLGNQMSQGTYRFEVEALDNSGSPIETLTSSLGDVTGIAFDDGITYLVLDSGRKVNLSEIQSIGL